MPIARFRMEDGRIARFNVPEGITPEQANALINQHISDISEPQQQAQSPIQQNTLGQDVAEEMDKESWLGRQAAGIGSSVADTYYGAKQMLKGSLSPEDEQNVKAWRSIKEAAPVGNIAGTILQYALPTRGLSKIAPVAKTIGAGGLASTGTIAGLGALEGGVQGALTPTLDNESRLGNIAFGSTIGAVAPVAIGAATKTVQYLGDPLKGMLSKKHANVIAGRAMAEAAGRKSATEVGADYEKVITELTKKQSGIISKQSAGQAAVNADVPTFSGMQAIADAYTTLPASKLETLQEAGRIKALRSIGRDAPGLETPKINLDAATKAKNTAADNLYSKAMVADDMRIDSIKKTLAQSKGGIGQVSPASVPIDSRIAPIMNNEVLSDVANTVARGNYEIGNPFSSLRGLDLIKKQLDSDILASQTGKTTAIKNVNEASLIAAKSKLLGAMEELSPSYRDARLKYSEMSLPIDRMKVGQVLEEALQGTLGAGERASVFANKIKAAEGIIKRTTGQARYDTLSKLFDARQMSAIKNVLHELEINDKLKKQAIAGAGEASRKLGVQLSEGTIPNMLNSTITITNNLLNRISASNKDRTLKMIADLMQDPKVAAEAMQNATAKEKAAIKFLINAQKNTANISTAAARSESKDKDE